MLRDADHQQAIEQFSFIHTLTLSDTATTTEPKSTPESDSALNSEPINPLDWLDLEEKPTNNNSNTSSSKSSSLASLATATSTIDASWLQIEPTSISHSLHIDETLFLPELEALNTTTTNRIAKYSDRILISLSCCYAIFVGWWLFGHQTGQLFAWLTRQQYISISESDAQFIQYMRRSIDNLTLETEIAQQDKKATEQSDRVVYVPVYTPATTTPVTPIAPEPIIPPPPPSTITPPPPPSTTISPPPPAEETQPSSSQSISATSITPPIDRSLVGILELGQQSAALFEINGMTRRIWLGEKIDDTGWILESVSDREAKVSYQGKTRSVSVGEKF